MGEHLIKPYEISVWEDKLIQYGENDYRLEENKLAVIGADTMTGLNKIYNPVFNKKNNGEKTLTFSLKYRYFDPYSGEQVENPFASYLINERKVKLKYDNQWYEFIVKNHTESTEEFTWTYTCTDAFVLELSKQGYNITFDSELNNNQGTAEDLAIETLKDTDWRVGEVDLFKQYIAEPIYEATLVNTSGIEIINASGDGVSIPSGSTPIYLFYSYVRNQDGKFVQFIIRDNNREYVIDDRQVITDTNFRIKTELVFRNNGFETANGTSIITIGNIETQYHANRLAYNKLSTYDKVMGRTVERLGISGDEREVYKYSDYVYTTSDVVMNYFTNGDDFNVLDNGSLQGWSPYTDNTGEIKDLELITNPPLGTGYPLVNINALAQIEGFLKVYFNGPRTIQNSNIYNTIYNSGFENSQSFINSISKGQEFVFRWRAGTGDIGSLNPVSLGMIVAKYTEELGEGGFYYKRINSSDIVLEFTGTPIELNNYIEGGSFEGTNYVINGVVQTPSTKYIYKTNNREYVWDNLTNSFQLLENTNYLPYYYLTAKATRSISHSELIDVNSNFGIFVYTTENIGENPIFIQDIQFTRFLLDTENNNTRSPIVIGNIPNASSKLIPYYYLQPTSDMTVDDIKTYTDLNELATELNVPVNNIQTLYNENSEKFLTISASQSNCFNILQTIAETFECWVDLEAEHDLNTGYIQRDNNGKLKKFVHLKEYAGKDNLAGFKYGINLESIERTINSDEIVTKLIVDQTQSDIVEEGYISIGNAPSNTSGESYILNFDYYYNQGLLDRQVVESDKLIFDVQVKDINNFIKQAEQLRQSYENSLIHLGSQRNDYTLMLEAARTTRNEALANFFKLTKMTYEEYVSVHQDIINEESKTETLTFPEGLVRNKIALTFLPKEEAEISLMVEEWNPSAPLATFSGQVPSTFNTNLYTSTEQVDTIVEANTTFDIVFDLDDDNIPPGIDIYINGHYTAEGSSLNWELNIATSQSTNLSGSRDLFDYEYDIANNILTITTNDTSIIIDSYTYNKDITIDYNGIKEFKFSCVPVVNKNVVVVYQLSSEGQVIDEETVASTLGELYASSAVINNYSGLLTNIEQEYWNVRKALRGSENYTVKFWKAEDYNSNTHVYVEASDYLQGCTFTLGGNSYQFDLSHKYFDIQTNSDEISFNISSMEGYSIEGNNPAIVSTSPTKIKLISSSRVDGIEQLIKTYQDNKDNLTKEFNNKYRHYIQEGTWSSTDYIDSELYYLDALQVSNTSSQPTVSYTINVVEISEIEGYEWYLFDAGDKSYIEDSEFFGWKDVGGIRTPIKEEVIVSEVEWHLDEPENNIITVQNYKTRFEDLFQRISAAVQTVQYNEASYTKTATILDATHTLNQNLLLDSLNKISGKNYSLTSNSSVVIDGEQILIQNLNNLANRVIINSEGIQVSSDGGITWKTVLSGRGLNLSGAYTGNINTNNIIISSDNNSSIRWDSSGISSYKINSDGTYDLNSYVRFDEYGLYGIKDDTFKAESLDDVINSAYFGVTWDGFFIRNSYSDGGRVSITSDDDFQVIDGNNIERIKIGSIGLDSNQERIYGININNRNGQSVFRTNNNGDLTMTGTINALGGNFTGIVNVGPTNQDHIIIDGTDASIKTSNYQDGAGYGWMINKDGDAVFNNITARGAIKTAVFEYAEIQAVGGIFIFRPSSTIKSARVDGTDLIVKVEKPLLFAKVRYEVASDVSVTNPQQVNWYEKTDYGYAKTTDTSVNSSKTYYTKNNITNGSWCKISNYISDGVPSDSTIQNILVNNGLSHVYKIKSVNTTTNEVILENAAAMVTGQYAITDISELEGGALIDMGREDGSTNYGIGVNSSDNTVNLPARAITLFETVVHPQSESIKITYNYRGILGTLPKLEYTGANAQVNSLYHNYMEGTQGIYTDNMYIGDKNQYIAFYTDGNNRKQLKIRADQFIFEVNDQTGEETTWEEHMDEQIPITVVIESSAGNLFIRDIINTQLTCTVYKGNTDITNSVTSFTWAKYNSDGTLDSSWSRLAGGRTITITNDDVQSKAIFTCTVEF